MRWVALGVDYEMAGKDLIDSVTLSSKICRALGGTPPEGFNYELFLDDQGQKISKSKGNGIAVEEWLAYATPESLSLYMFQKPKTAKKLYFDVIPKAVDDYFGFLDSYHKESPGKAAGKSHLAHPQRHAASAFRAGELRSALEPCQRFERAYQGYPVAVREELCAGSEC